MIVPAILHLHSPESRAAREAGRQGRWAIRGPGCERSPQGTIRCHADELVGTLEALALAVVKDGPRVASFGQWSAASLGGGGGEPEARRPQSGRDPAPGRPSGGKLHLVGGSRRHATPTPGNLRGRPFFHPRLHPKDCRMSLDPSCQFPPSAGRRVLNPAEQVARMRAVQAELAEAERKEQRARWRGDITRQLSKTVHLALATQATYYPASAPQWTKESLADIAAEILAAIDDGQVEGIALVEQPRQLTIPGGAP